MLALQGDRVILCHLDARQNAHVVAICTIVHAVELRGDESVHTLRLVDKSCKPPQEHRTLSLPLRRSLEPAAPNDFDAKWDLVLDHEHTETT